MCNIRCLLLVQSLFRQILLNFLWFLHSLNLLWQTRNILLLFIQLQVNGEQSNYGRTTICAITTFVGSNKLELVKSKLWSCKMPLSQTQSQTDYLLFRGIKKIFHSMFYSKIFILLLKWKKVMLNTLFSSFSFDSIVSWNINNRLVLN